MKKQNKKSNKSKKELTKLNHKTIWLRNQEKNLTLSQTKKGSRKNSSLTDGRKILKLQGNSFSYFFRKPFAKICTPCGNVKNM